MKKKLGIIIGSFLALVLLVTVNTIKATNYIANKVYLDNQEVNVNAISGNSTNFIDLESIFNVLDASLRFDKNNNRYIGAFNDTSIVFPLDKKEFYYDAVPIPLDSKIKTIDGIKMVDAKFLDYLYGIDYKFSKGIYLKQTKYQEEDVFQTTLKNITGGKLIASHKSDSLDKNALHYDGEKHTQTVTEVDHQGFTKVKELQIKEMNEYTNPSAMRLAYSYENTIKPKDVLLVSFYARVTDTNDIYGNGAIEVHLGEYYNGTNYELVNLTQEFKKYYVLLEHRGQNNLVSNDYTVLTLQTAGFNLQTIQVADLEIYNYENTLNFDELTKIKETNYKGSEDNALWRRVALERINDIRKKDVQIIVKDLNGNLIPDANINLQMQEHNFNFGAAIDGPGLANNKEYENKIKELFNTVVSQNDFKWGIYSRNSEPADLVYKFAEDNNLNIRGHALLWDCINSDGVGYDAFPQVDEKGNSINWSTISKADALKITKSHILEMYQKYPNIYQWDFINEPVYCDNLRKRNDFDYAFFAELFNYAKSINPNIKLIINEGLDNGIINDVPGNYIRSKYIEFKDILKNYKNSGMNIDGIGIQSHTDRLYYPQDFYNQMTDLGSYAKTISITEYDLSRNIDSDKLGAKFLEDLLILSYSHPQVDTFMIWSFWDSVIWGGSTADAVMYDDNWNARLAVDSYKKLLDSWTTNVKGSTNTKGSYKTNAFDGSYLLTVNYEDINITNTFNTNDKSVIEITLPIIIKEDVVILAKPTPIFIEETSHKDPMLNNMVNTNNNKTDKPINEVEKESEKENNVEEKSNNKVEEIKPIKKKKNYIYLIIPFLLIILIIVWIRRHMKRSN